jgi:hypothetical protein
MERNVFWGVTAGSVQHRPWQQTTLPLPRDSTNVIASISIVFVKTSVQTAGLSTFRERSCLAYKIIKYSSQRDEHFAAPWIEPALRDPRRDYILRCLFATATSVSRHTTDHISVLFTPTAYQRDPLSLPLTYEQSRQKLQGTVNRIPMEEEILFPRPISISLGYLFLDMTILPRPYCKPSWLRRPVTNPDSISCAYNRVHFTEHIFWHMSAVRTWTLKMDAAYCTDT